MCGRGVIHPMVCRCCECRSRRGIADWLAEPLTKRAFLAAFSIVAVGISTIAIFIIINF